MRADLPAALREDGALRRMRGQRLAVAPDPIILRIERALAPVGRFIRRASR